MRPESGGPMIGAAIEKGGGIMTTVTKWSPFRELEWEPRMRRFFDEIGFVPFVLPPADAYETKDEFIVELDVPGFEEKELGIEVSDHTLTIKGEHLQTTEEHEKIFRLRERFAREFERRFALPATVDTEHLTATFANGILKVHAPKLAVSKPHKIAISKN
jgi:HSP20 family protein